MATPAPAVDVEGEPLIPKDPAPLTADVKLAIGLAVAFLLCFNVAFLVAGVVSLGSVCDAPLAGYLLVYGIIALSGSMVLFAILLKFTSMEKHAFKVVVFFMVLLLLVSISGLMGYKGSQTCSETAPTLYKWAFGCLLTYFVLLFIMISVPLIVIVAPILGKILGFLLGLLAQLVGALNGAADGLKDFTGADGKSFIALVASYVNAAALMWFLVFFLAELMPVFDKPCDKPLAIYVLVSCVVGVVVVMGNFYQSVLFNPPADAKPTSKMLVAVVMIVMILWGLLGISWYKGAVSCPATAPRVYELAGLMTLVWYAVLLLLILMLLLAGLGILGKMKLVVVIDKEKK